MRTRALLSASLLLLLGAVLLPLLADGAPPDDSPLQGTWRLSGETPANNSGRAMAWYLEWKFSNGRFLQTGYPPLAQQGRYRVLKSEANQLTLELYEQKGNFGAADRKIEVTVAESGTELKIDGKSGFVRTDKK